MIRDVRFFSPIIAASGTFGYGDEVQEFVDLSKIGSVKLTDYIIHKINNKWESLLN